MKNYCLYLRKSRADAEAEARGEGETLARHEKTLLELAKKNNLQIVAEYREIVSGDSIAARPQMQAMLADMEDGRYAGVLCMEIERLARGNTIDQGIVAQAFKDSGTLIITPVKTYDPNNEFDEEYFEFSLFMSRREYKTIKRRMQAGRLASIKEGCYISPEAPYGYRKIHPEPKIHTLEIVPEEAEVVRLIYDLYQNGKGARAITTELNRRGLMPRKNPCWEIASIRKILKNPVYAGLLQWRTKDNSNNNTCYPGLHPAIIEPEVFWSTQEQRRTNPAAQLPVDQTLCNYYHNILYCGFCGHQLGRRFVKHSGKAHMLCRYKQCTGKTVSASMQSVDEALLSALRYRMEELKALKALEGKQKQQDQKQEQNKPEKIRKQLEQELQRLIKQQNKLYDFLEQEIYDTNTFLERMKLLNEKKKILEDQIADCKQEESLPERSPEESMMQLQYVIDHFQESNAEEKNRLLHSIIIKINYYKTERACYRKPDTDLKLEIVFR